MNASELLRIVDSLHRDKNIDKEIVFRAIESAMISAARKHYGEEAEISFVINREDGEIVGVANGESVQWEEIVGRIGAQTAKQVIIQKVREAERDSLVDEFEQQIDELVSGIIQRSDSGITTVSLGSLEAILPRAEQIPDERHHANERVRAVIAEVKSQGNRVKVILSRTRPKFVQRLFEQEIPEISDGVITFNGIAREPGYRSKVAVSSSDSQVDCVGACVGVRGTRIKSIIDELSGERIDIVRHEEDPQMMIPNALQPAQVSEVILCQMLGRAIVLVEEDQLSLAIGRRGQNVRLASKLCGWDIEIMTQEELENQIEKAVTGFSSLDGVDENLANSLVGEGYLSYDDLSVIEPDDFMAMGDLSAEEADKIVLEAEERAEAAEIAEAAEKRARKEQERIDKKAAEVEAAKLRKALAEADAEQKQAQEQSAELKTDESETAQTEEASDAESVGENGASPEASDGKEVKTKAEEG